MTVIESSRPTPGSNLFGRANKTPFLFLLRRRPRTHAGIVVVVSAVWFGLLVLVALIVQWLPLHKYGVAVGTPSQPPNWSREFLGTDVGGRSMLSRILYGGRTSLLISSIATAASAIVGGTLGLISAYFGSTMRVIGDIVANTLLSLPGLLLVIFMVLVLGDSVPMITLACALVFVAQFLRLTRSNAATELTREYIVAARGLGASPWRIIFKELLPNVWPSLISYAALVMPAVMILEGGLSFLGYGVQQPDPSWGNMIALGDSELSVAPWGALTPCIFLVISVFSLITISDYLRVRLTFRGRLE